MLRGKALLDWIVNKGDLKYLFKRLLLVFPTMFIVVAIVFILTRISGNPVTVALGDKLSEADLQARLHSLGFDRPIWVQFWEYFIAVLQGNLGNSIRTGTPVSEIVGAYLPATLELGILTLAVALPLSLWLGRVAYRNVGNDLDKTIRLSALIGYALPIYLAAIVLRLIFSTWLDWLPSNGRVSIINQMYLDAGSTKTGFYFFDALISGRISLWTDLLMHAALPAITLALTIGGTLVRAIRSSYIESSKSPVAEYASMMGMSRKSIERKLIAPAAKSEIIAVFGLTITSVLAGVVFTETAFEWRGLGYAVNHYIASRDMNVVQGLAITLSVIVVLFHSIADWLSRLATPKISRYQEN